MEKKGDLSAPKPDFDDNRSLVDLRAVDARRINLLEEQHYGAPETGYQETEYELPGWYGSTEITAMVRDPRWIFVYWEITPSCAGRLRNQIGEHTFSMSNTVLRVHDLTESPEGKTYMDIPVETETDNWYIQVPSAGHAYRVAIGKKHLDRFHPFAESNTVCTPPGNVSDLEDEEYMTVSQLYSLCAGYALGESSPAILAGINQRLEHEMGSPAIISIGSPMGKREEEKHMWLQVNTDLILYGRAAPGTTVTVHGRRVQCTEDGSFSVRYTLVDGRLVLPVTAAGNAGEITIIPEITKQTH